MAAVRRLIHTGQALVDYVLHIDELPRRGGNVFASTERRSAGGAVNILLAAVRNGAEVVHAGAHGTGQNGDLIRAALEAEGVRLASSPEPDLDSGICVCLLEPNERTFVTTLGAERRISIESLDAARPAVGDIVCVDGYSLVAPSTVEPMLDWLERLDTRIEIVLDPGADLAAQPTEILRRALRCVTVWTSNRAEAGDMLVALDPAAERPADMAHAAQAMRGVLQPGAVVIVRDGAAGCAVAADEAPVVLAGFPQRPTDTNGAGDAHTGILLAARLAGTPWEHAAHRANAGAAIKVTRAGPATAPSTAEIDAFLAGGQERGSGSLG